MRMATWSQLSLVRSPADVTVKERLPVPELSASGTNIRWYSDYNLTNLIYSGDSYTTGKYEIGIYDYYVTQTIGECESSPKTVLLTILEGIKRPEVTGDTVCQGETAILYAKGQNIKWYNDAAHSVILHEGNSYSPTTTESGLHTYYVTQTLDSIESGSSLSTCLVKPAPPPVYAEDKTFCAEDGLFMNAIGNHIKWRTDFFVPEKLFDSRYNRYYDVVAIGEQVWMAENLDMGHMIDGSLEQADNQRAEKYYYNNDPENGSIYGALYQYREMIQYGEDWNICPFGWHLPSNEEWKKLEMTLGMSREEANKLGFRGNNEGLALQSGGSSGFNALFSGKRNIAGFFENQGYYTTFWTSDGYTRTLSSFFDQIYAGRGDEYTNGFSVRCLMDDSAYIRWDYDLPLDGFPVGEYTFYVTNTLKECESLPDTVHLSLREKPQPPLVADQETCLGGERPILDASGQNVKWYFDDIPPSFRDLRDNKIYNTLTIGNQVWMRENLDIGMMINGKLDQTNNGIIEKYHYNNEESYQVNFNGLYQWDELMNYSTLEGSQGICPDGWRVPSHKDWMELEITLGMNQAEASVYGWRGTNQGLLLKRGGGSGFDALVAGKRDVNGEFVSAYDYGTFWNSSGYSRTLRYGPVYPKVWSSRDDEENNGFSVRCIMNDSAYTFSGTHLPVPDNSPGTYHYAVTQTIAGCESDRADVKLVLKEVPDLPLVEDISVCEGLPVPDLVAVGEDIRWYKTKDLTEWVHSGGHYTSGLSAPGTYTWYVTQSSAGCESLPSEINMVIKPAVVPPLVSDTAVCEGNPVPGLEAKGENILWYSDASLLLQVGSGAHFATGHTDAGTYSYFVTQEKDGCTSPPAIAVLQIEPVPPAPQVEDGSVCEGDTIPALRASGEHITWYEDAALSNKVFSGESYQPVIEEPGTYTWYVTQTVQGCEGPAGGTSLIIRSAPASPEGMDTSVCRYDPVPDLYVEGEGVRWYVASDLINPVHEGNTFESGMTVPGVFQFYASQTSGGCESPKVPVHLEIRDLPSPPVASAVAVCEGLPVPGLHAEGLLIRWYADESLTTLVDSGNDYVPVDSSPGVYRFYATQSSGGCESEAAAGLLRIDEMPVVDLGPDTAITQDQTLILGPLPEGCEYLWNDGSTGSFLIINGGDYDPGELSWSVHVTRGVCETDDVVLVRIEKPIGVRPLLDDFVKIFPNPTTGRITVQFNEPLTRDLLIEVYDARGRIVQKFQGKGTENTGRSSVSFDLGERGIYLVRITDRQRGVRRKVVRY